MYKGNNAISSVYKGGSVINIIKKGLITVYEAFKELIVSGIPPLTLTNCKGADLVDYKVYGNSEQDGTPMPDTPIEIQSVGDKTKNLFNLNKITTNGRGIEEFENKLCFHYKDGHSNFELPINCKENTQYTLTFKFYRKEEHKNKITNIKLYYSDGTGINKIVSPNQTNNIVSLQGKTLIKISGSDSYSLDAWIDLSVTQLEEGDTATEYEPYGYKVPVKVSGKNLFNKEVAGNSENWEKINYRYYPIYVGAGNNVTISYGENLEVGLGFYIVIGYLESHKGMATGTWLYHNSKKNLIKTEVTVTADNAGYIYLNVAGNATNLEQYIFNNNFQIEINPTKTEYEPYVEPITTNIYLDEPLRKVGDYADYIDFEKQKVYKNVEVIDNTGTLILEESLSGVVDNVGTNIELPNIPTFKGTNIIEVDTEIQPSNAEVIYKGKN